MNWLEISLTVDGELAEAVADVLARFAPNGVTTEQAVRFNDAEDEGTPVGPITVRAYLAADDSLYATRQRLEQALYFLGRIQPLPTPVFTPVPDQDWMQAWKVNYRPIQVGERLLIVPAWMEVPDEGRLAIRIDPGMAFGTGTHPTTQLCLAFVEQIMSASLSPQQVIDIGCGSGILSIAAIKLGAGHVLGVDIDGAAVQASRENARLNGVAETDFQLGVGSVDEVRAGSFEIRKGYLVLANILAPVLVRLFDRGLADLLAPGGGMVLSGILQEQSESVISAARQKGLELAEKKPMGDWVALLVR